MALGGLLCAARGEVPAAPQPVSAEVVAAWPEVRLATFDLVWGTVQDAYFDPAFGGVDWARLRTHYRPQAERTEDLGALRDVLQEMLDRLGRSHFAIMPREAAVFVPEERDRIGTIGATIVAVAGEAAIGAVTAESAAARAGLVPGDVVLAVGGYELAQARSHVAATGWSEARKATYLADLVTGRLQSGVGSTIDLRVRRRDGAVATLTVTTEANEGAWSEPVGNFPSMPIECEARYLQPGIAYLRLSSFTPGLMGQVRTFLRSLAKRDKLVIDLRGNRGGLSGMAIGIAGLLVDREMTLGSMRLRRGMLHFEVYPQERAFSGPVALLVDHASASTSEILAAGLQEAGRAGLFGETTAGAALPSAFKQLPTGDLFQYAIADVQTPAKKLIEGVGVQPDETIERSGADLAAGEDPVLARALRWLGAALPADGSPVPATALSAAVNGSGRTGEEGR